MMKTKLLQLLGNTEQQNFNMGLELLFSLGSDKSALYAFLPKLETCEDWEQLLKISREVNSQFGKQLAVELLALLAKNSVAWTQKIEILYIEYGNLTSIPKDFCHVKNLKRLGLSNNKLTDLPIELRALSKLQYLSLHANPLHTLPECVIHYTNLQELVLGWDKITSLPDGIGNLSQLNKIQIWNSKITSLPETVGSWTNLEKAFLKGNQIQYLPESIASWSNVRDITLQSNALTSLPHSCAQLVNLYSLNVSYNRLRSLPEDIGSLPKLYRLEFVNNPIQRLPTSLHAKIGLFTLKNGYLYENFILRPNKEVSREVQKQKLHAIHEKYPTLETLSVDWGIKYLDDIIGRFTHLKELNLTENNIEVFSDRIGCLSSLEYLNLNDSGSWETLPDSFGQLVGLKKLEYHWKKHNIILPFLKFFKNLKHITLEVHRMHTESNEQEFITEIKTILPNCNVSTFYDSNE